MHNNYLRITSSRTQEVAMSMAQAFSNGKQALRRGAIALAAGAALFGANAAQAASFTDKECRIISAVARDVVRTLGKEKLSSQFRESLINFMAPDGKTLTCDGPTQIRTPTGPDVDAFNTIRTILLAGDNPISLQKRGLVSVASLELD